MKKSIRYMLGMIALSSFLWYCSGQSENAERGNSSQEKPTHGGTIVIGISGDVDSFNPFFGESVSAQEITHMMLLGLADLNDKSEFSPELATHWEHSADFLKLTYHLRKNARWSDGHPISAEDVKFTFDLLMDPKVASPRQGFTEYIKEVVVIDSHTVTFEFSEAYPAQIFDTAGEVLPKHILKDADRASLRSHDFNRNPLSSGPFKLHKWISQQSIELVPNEHYFAEQPYLDKVIFKIVPDNTNLLMQLESGEIDMVSGILPSEVERLQSKNANIEMYQVSGRVYYNIGYNEKNDLFGSVKVRRALTMAIDREKIIEALLYGYGSKCLGPLPPIVEWAYNEDVKEIPYDPKQAAEMLEKEGWLDSDQNGLLDKNGNEFQFTLLVNTGNQIKADAAIVVQNQLSKIGIGVKIQTLEWTNFLNHVQAKNFDAVMGGLSSSFYIDPTPVFHSSATNLFNSVSYANPEVDRLIELGRQEMDQVKAAQIWKEFQNLVYEDQPYTFLFWKDKAVAVNKNFKNVTPIALSSVYDIERWYLSN